MIVEKNLAFTARSKGMIYANKTRDCEKNRNYLQEKPRSIILFIILFWLWKTRNLHPRHLDPIDSSSRSL